MQVVKTKGTVMGNRPADRLALLSLHPKHADAIIKGTKKVEFRKRPLAPDITCVVIYATSPVGRVVAVFSIKEQVIGTPQRLWRTYRGEAGGSRAQFLAYYDGRSEGFGIRIGKIVSLAEPLSLRDAFGIRRPPQSVQYFTEREAKPKLARALARAYQPGTETESANQARLRRQAALRSRVHRVR